MFGTIKVLAGDFSKNDHHQYVDGAFLMETAPTPLGFRGKRERIPISEVIEFQAADKDNMENLVDSIGWSMAGKAVTFTATFSDNRKIFATTDNQTYVKIKAAIWEKKNISKSDYKNTASNSAATEFPRKYEVEKPFAGYDVGALILCPQCNKGVPASADNCPICGYQLVPEKRAKKTPTRALRRFSEDDVSIGAECPKCGRVLKIDKANMIQAIDGFDLRQSVLCPCEETYSKIVNTAAAEVPRKYEVEKPWSDNVALVVVLMILVWPIGFYGLWRSKNITTDSKLLWTALFIVLIIIGFIIKATTPN